MEKQGYVAVRDNTKIYYQCIGHGEPLLLLHGNSADHRFFAKQVEALKNDFLLILMDSRGHGKSENLQDDLTFTMIAEDIYDLLQHLQLKQVSLLGFSDGGNIAILFSDLYPQCVKRVIAMGANITFDGTHMFSRVGSWLSYLLFAFLQWVNPAFRQPFLAKRLLLHDLPLHWRDLETIQPPILWVVGQWDFVRWGHTQTVAQHLPHVYVVRFLMQGHFVPTKKPEQFNALVRQFIKGDFDETCQSTQTFFSEV